MKTKYKAVRGDCEFSIADHYRSVTKREATFFLVWEAACDFVRAESQRLSACVVE